MSHGISKSEGLAMIERFIEVSDGFYVVDGVPGQHGPIMDGWMAQVRIGQTIITANNGVLQIDAFSTVEDATEILQKSLNTAVALGMFTFDRGSITPGKADPAEVASVRAGIEAAKRQAAAYERLQERAAALMDRLNASGDGPSLSPGSVDALHGMVQVDDTDADWRPGMYV